MFDMVSLSYNLDSLSGASTVIGQLCFSGWINKRSIVSKRTEWSAFISALQAAAATNQYMLGRGRRRRSLPPPPALLPFPAPSRSVACIHRVQIQHLSRRTTKTETINHQLQTRQELFFFFFFWDILLKKSI